MYKKIWQEYIVQNIPYEYNVPFLMHSKCPLRAQCTIFIELRVTFALNFSGESFCSTVTIKNILAHTSLHSLSIQKSTFYSESFFLLLLLFFITNFYSQYVISIFSPKYILYKKFFFFNHNIKYILD